MAAVDRRMPNLDDFVGLNWSCWVDTVDTEPSDVPSEDTKSGRDCCETMTLRKEDMPIYGHCPAQDDFYLVVCSHCGKLVKPQAFEDHCNRRHSSLSKTCLPSSSIPLQQPRTTRPCTPSQNVSKERQRDSRLNETRVPSSPSQRRPSKPLKVAASLPTVDKITQDKSHPAFPQRPKSHLLSSVPPLSNNCRSSASSSVTFSSSVRPSSMKPSVQKPTTAQTTYSPHCDTRAYNNKTSINKKCEDQDKKKLSTQHPTQTMDMNQQLKTKTDSDLPNMASSLRDSEMAHVKTKTTESQGPPKENSSRCSKFTLNSNNHIARPRDTSENTAMEESTVVEVEVQPPYPFNQSLPSSDNSDNEEECTDVPFTPWHPKPLGLCTFGCRAFGCSVFTFDRRLHHLRIALSAMLEDHVNSHLWKKMPQPASNLRSAHATSSTRESPIRIGARSSATGSFNVKSTSLERLKNTKNNSKRTKSPPSSPTMPCSGQQSSSAVQTSKAHMGQRELMQITKTVQKPQLSHTTPSKHIASSNTLIPGSLSKKTPPLSPLRPSERNTTLLNESLPPNPCPARSKGRTPGIVQPRAGSCDDRAVVQKRNTQPTMAPTSSSPSKKCPRLSPPSRSSLFSWKRDNTQDVWLGVWRKEHTSEDDTPGQY